MILHFLKTKNLPIYTQLSLEESIIKTDLNSWCIINEGSPLSIVMGASNKPKELLDLSKIKNNIPIIKRFSGGGSVIVDENSIFVTFIFSKKYLNFYFPNEIFQWTTQFYKEIFQSKDFALKENDFTIKNKKCAGNAQYIKNNNWLHHSCFLWDYKLENMQYLLLPTKIPNYRKKRTHENFLCTIKSQFVSKNSFIKKIKTNLQKRFVLKDVSLNQALVFTKKEYRKNTYIVSI